MRFAAIAIIILALFNINNAWALSGSNINIGTFLKPVWCTFAICDNQLDNTSQSTTAVQNATIAITNSGYSPNELTVKAGSSITLNLKNIGGRGCTQSFTIPSLGIQKTVLYGTSDTIAFNTTSEDQDIPFMCGMGMYRGKLHVRKA